MHASRPSPASCSELLRALPALSALRRTLRESNPDTPGWLPALVVLGRAPEALRLSQIADALHIDASVASRQVANLEYEGLAERSPDPADRRASLIAATDEGRVLLGETMERFAAHMSSLLDGWTDDDVGSLTQLLVRLAATLEPSPTAGATS